MGREIGAVKGLREFSAAADAELSLDVFSDGAICRCCQGYYGGSRGPRSEDAELLVIGTKVMIPLTYAVGFVDDDPGLVVLLELFGNGDEFVTFLDCFGGYVDEVR
jgi:hypothetical protein